MLLPVKKLFICIINIWHRSVAILLPYMTIRCAQGGSLSTEETRLMTVGLWAQTVTGDLDARILQTMRNH